MNEPINIWGVTVTIEDAAKFAPVVRFQPKEEYYPCSIDYLLSGSTLVLGNNQEIPQPSQTDLYNARNNPAAYLRIGESVWGGEPRNANLVTAPMYVCPQVPEDGSFVDFNYFSLWAFNGPQAVWVRTSKWNVVSSFDCALPNFAMHEGDVEGVVVRVKPDFSEIIHVAYYAHGDATYYYPNQLLFADAQQHHPLVHCAIFSHASYNPRDTVRFARDKESFKVTVETEEVPSATLFFIDDISTGDVIWQPFTQSGGQSLPNGRLVFIGFDPDVDHPINNQPWVSFKGDLGEKRDNKFVGPIPIRAKLTKYQYRYFGVGVRIADLTGLIPEKYKRSAGPDGFGKRPEQMVITQPNPIPTDVALIVSKLNPTYVVGLDPENETGPVTMQPLPLNQAPHYNHEWLRRTLSKGYRYEFISEATNTAAGVPVDSPADTCVTLFPAAQPNDGTVWTMAGDDRAALRPAYNPDLNMASRVQDYKDQPVCIQEWESGGTPQETWGVVPIIQGVSRPGLICMYKSYSFLDLTLWWTVFDPATGTWFPDAAVGPGAYSWVAPALVWFNDGICAVYADPSQQLQYMYLDLSNNLWSASQPIGRIWSSATPALAAYKNALFCVHKGADGDKRLLWTVSEDYPWSPDKPFPFGTTNTAPALAVFPDKDSCERLCCVYCDDDAVMHWTLFDDDQQNWVDDRPIDLGPEVDGVASVAVTIFNRVMYCVYTDLNQQLGWAVYDPRTNTWSPGKPFGGEMSTRAAASLAVFDGTLYCAHVGAKSDVDLYWTKLDPATGRWIQDAPFSFGCRSFSGPALLALRLPTP